MSVAVAQRERHVLAGGDGAHRLEHARQPAVGSLHTPRDISERIALSALATITPTSATSTATAATIAAATAASIAHALAATTAL